MLGRSPRTRGRPRWRRTCRPSWRSIPAYAGETHIEIADHHALEVDPRVRGGDALAEKPPECGQGRSPRTRGRRWMRLNSVVSIRSIPAYAGETARRRADLDGEGVDPRVRGGDTLLLFSGVISTGRSPRTRGRLALALAPHSPERSIPAYAGETHPPRIFLRSPGVDPRVRGGD